MKKYMIAAFSVLTLAGCSQGLKTAEENPMLGRWLCVTNYYDFQGIGARTEDAIEFDKDGVYYANSVISLPIIAKPLFVYHQSTLGKWEFKNNELIVMTADINTEAAHSKETIQKLKKDKKLRDIEKIFMNMFEHNTGKMTFKIIKQEGDTVLQEQKLGNTSYFPYCMKAEAIEKKLKTGEIKLKSPN